jgi:hypothetical protein
LSATRRAIKAATENFMVGCVRVGKVEGRCQYFIMWSIEIY